MKKVLAFLALIATFAAVTMVTGCDPEKVGGGGHMQSYDGGTGRYN